MVERAPGSDVAFLRRLNFERVFGLLRASPDRALTVSELSSASGLSRPTVSATLGDLTEAEFAHQVASTSVASAGRPAKQFQFNRTAGYLVGADLGPRSATILVADLTGEIVASRRHSIAQHDPKTALSSLVGELDDVLGGREFAHTVRAITIAVPGVVDRSGQLRASTVVPKWVGYNLISAVSRAYPSAEVELGNDVKLATFAEYAFGASAGTSHSIYVSIGRRISAGIVANGALQAGATGSAGEIGAAPASGWAAAVESVTASDDRSLGEIAVAARDGDEPSQAIISTLAAAIGDGLALLTLAVDPEVVVLAGPAAQAGEALAAPLRLTLAAVALYPPRVIIAEIAEHPSARGAVQTSLALFARSITTTLDPIP